MPLTDGFAVAVTAGNRETAVYRGRMSFVPFPGRSIFLSYPPNRSSLSRNRSQDPKRSHPPNNLSHPRNRSSNPSDKPSHSQNAVMKKNGSIFRKILTIDPQRNGSRCAGEIINQNQTRNKNQNQTLNKNQNQTRNPNHNGITINEAHRR